MKIITATIIISMFAISCKPNVEDETLKPGARAIVGTWQLVKGTLIEKDDTVITDYRKSASFIKIINDTHFAFLHHDLNKGKDSVAVFVAGGGRYSLTDSSYTEHLEYCSAREWESNDFTFTVSVKDDTLIQRGIEKIESSGINRLNIEQYIRVKK